MKTRSPLYAIAIGLTGILVVSMGLIALGSRQSRAFPSADSYLPSGTAAFAELLRQSGYRVVIDHGVKPKLQEGDLVVAFTMYQPFSLSLLTSEADEDQLDRTKESITEFVSNGGDLLSLPIAPDFADVSRLLYDSKVPINSNQFDANVSWNQVESPGFYLDAGDLTTAIQVWGTDDDENQAVDSTVPFVMVKVVEEGREANVANGIVATNRFIDRQQNALVLMDAVRMISRPGSRVVFAEATFGNAREPGLLETIGPWALAAWMQFVFLGIVVIYTLGKPFGLPDPERRKERGARDLMDAIADSMKRGRMTKMAIRIVLDDTKRFLRKLYRGKRGLDKNELQSNNLGDLQRAMTKLEAAAEIRAPEGMVVTMIKDVETLVRDAGSRGGTY